MLYHGYYKNDRIQNNKIYYLDSDSRYIERIKIFKKQVTQSVERIYTFCYNTDIFNLLFLATSMVEVVKPSK